MKKKINNKRNGQWNERKKNLLKSYRVNDNSRGKYQMDEWKPKTEKCSHVKQVTRISHSDLNFGNWQYKEWEIELKQHQKEQNNRRAANMY